MTFTSSSWTRSRSRIWPIIYRLLHTGGARLFSSVHWRGPPRTNQIRFVSGRIYLQDSPLLKPDAWTGTDAVWLDSSWVVTYLSSDTILSMYQHHLHQHYRTELCIEQKRIGVCLLDTFVSGNCGHANIFKFVSLAHNTCFRSVIVPITTHYLICGDATFRASPTRKNTELNYGCP